MLDRAGQVRAWHWVAASGLILMLDYVTGPFVQFALLFILPVALATAWGGPWAGVVVGAVLPLVRFGFFLRWGVPGGPALLALDAGTDVVILVGFAFLVHRLLAQQLQIQVLTGLLPICSFCKRIREESGEWRQLETYIADRSEARFSHTFCPECGREHYPGMAE